MRFFVASRRETVTCHDNDTNWRGRICCLSPDNPHPLGRPHFYTVLLTSAAPQSNTHLVGLVVKASAPRAADPGSIPAFPVGIFPGRVIPLT